MLAPLDRLIPACQPAQQEQRIIQVGVLIARDAEIINVAFLFFRLPCADAVIADDAVQLPPQLEQGILVGAAGKDQVCLRMRRADVARQIFGFFIQLGKNISVAAAPVGEKCGETGYLRNAG